jgi:hypothetical protein
MAKSGLDCRTLSWYCAGALLALLIHRCAHADMPTDVEQVAIDAVWAAYPWDVQKPRFEVIHDPDEVPPDWSSSWKAWGNAQSVKPSNPCRGWNGTWFAEQSTIYLLNIVSPAVASRINAECWGTPGGYAVRVSDYTPARLESLAAYELGHVIHAAPDLSAGLDAFVGEVMETVAKKAGERDAAYFIPWSDGLPPPEDITLKGRAWHLVSVDGVRREYQSDLGTAWVVLY